MISRYTPIPKRRNRPRRGRFADKTYLDWIREQPCATCPEGEQTTKTEAAHMGAHALSMKAPDRQAIPLCAKCHRTGLWAYHGLSPVIWAAHHNINVAKLIRKYNDAYDAGLEIAA